MKCYSLVFNDFSRPIHYLATLSRLLDNCNTCTVCVPNFFFSASGIFFQFCLLYWSAEKIYAFCKTKALMCQLCGERYLR